MATQKKHVTKATVGHARERTRGDVVGPSVSERLRDLASSLADWIKHVPEWLEYPVRFDRTEEEIHAYAAHLEAAMVEMNMATRGLTGRRRREDLRNDVLSGVSFFGGLCARDLAAGESEEVRRTRALDRAASIIGVVLSPNAPDLAARASVADLADVLMLRAASLAVMKGKRLPRPKGTSYLARFSEFWRGTTGERVDPHSLGTSFDRWTRKRRRHRSIKSAVPASKTRSNVSSGRTDAVPKGNRT